MFSSPASEASSSSSGFGSASSSSMSNPASSRSSPVHAAFLVDPANHSPALLQLIDIKLSRPVIVASPTVLAALVYVARARPHLSIALEEWALERVFLSALIAASKYTNDSTLKKNMH
ncbi:hypothetical protein B0H17DRAFT_1192382 [Mycena rosella]|uniref:Cyclin N-terminal domain-containing protein n=1 Tax=Mycena rosella TaxID=1033263 RepID=A0AAD7GWX2_MYCRO|nr:hypothetical protein B0H17DRAFT_1192382 [Mycena rosella]